jgi:putative ABC transport system permease protein
MIIKMAFRNIFRQKRRSLLTGLSMFGGFVLAVIFIGWADGSYNNIIDNFTRYNTGHIQIHEGNYLDRPSIYKTIDDYPAVEGVLKKIPEIDSWAPRLYSVGLVSVGDKSSGARIIGIDPEAEDRTTSFNTKIIEGAAFSAPFAHQALIGKGLAKLLNAGTGDEIVIVSQAADGSIANDSYTIIGLVDSGNEVADRSAFYLPLGIAQDLLVLDNRIHEVAVTVRHLGSVQPVTARLKQDFAGTKLDVAPWQVFAKSFYKAMSADMEGLWITLVIIVLIVAVGVFNTVLMSVLERIREYGVLKAVGTKPGQIVRLVLAEINILAVFAVLFGMAAGYFFNYLLSTHGVTLAQGFSYGGMVFKTMKSEINARSFYIPALTVFISAFLVGLFPAIKAARTDPAKSMRFH